MPTKPTEDKIHVALAFDQYFWAPAYATMRAVCLATHRRPNLVFHLCHTHLDEQSMADLDKISEEFGSALVHYDLDRDGEFSRLAKLLPYTKFHSPVMYARLLFDRLLPPEVDRLVYLDCDIFVRAPIEQLIGVELKGQPVGAVADPHALRFFNGRDGKEKRDLFDPADPHFNSGVMVIDLAAWRELNMIVEINRLETRGVLGRLSNDQEILNFIFNNRWTQIDQLWNAIAANRAMEVFDLKAVHYTGINKPWNLANGLAYSRTYRHAMTNELFYRYMRYRTMKRLKGWGRKLLGRG